MLGDKKALPTIPVKDLEKAKKFYKDTLGLKPSETDEPMVIMFKSGDSSVLVYQSQYAGTNQATAVSWEVGDVEREVQVLKDKGVAFEHYDMPGTTRRGDVHLTGKTKTAWFKDPDGNIHAIVGP
jgi:catechol 2,3-dioxygenase-like lactoylglutathione lyase family enzyme